MYGVLVKDLLRLVLALIYQYNIILTDFWKGCHMIILGSWKTVAQHLVENCTSVHTTKIKGKKSAMVSWYGRRPDSSHEQKSSLTGTPWKENPKVAVF